MGSNSRGIRCFCSRCNLYLNNQTVDKGDFDYRAMTEFCDIQFEDRRYQTALLEYAKNRNVIACLPTGSGKTFIALKLIEHYKTQIIHEDKKAFFLANTIPLVNQQAAFIARNSPFKVRHLTGDMNVDYWSVDKWASIVQEFQVMAMTSQIFLNMVRHGYIRFSQICLLIFDEVHHATASHPMAEIMKEYARTTQLQSTYPMPRILGLSATIILGNCTPIQVPQKVRELESTMMSAAITYKDYEEVIPHSTSSIIEKCSFSPNYEVDSSILMEFDGYSSQLQKLRKERKKAKLGAAGITPDVLDPTLRTLDNVYNLQAKKPSPGDLRVAVDDVRYTYKELGLYCTLIALNLRLAFIKFSLMDLNDGQVKEWYLKIQEYFEKLKVKFQDIMDSEQVDRKKQITQFVSPKLEMLIKILEKYRPTTPSACPFKSSESSCGLLFCDRRATAQVLAWYLQDLANFSTEKEKHGYLQAHFVVGTSRSAFESVETRVYARKQTDILNMFRSGKLNLLTATTVLEEGIDVPSCNFIIRFDDVKTYTSFIQSMGRARKRGAKFFAMIPEEDFHKQSEKLDTFQRVNQAIVSYLKANVEKIDADRHVIDPVDERDVIPPICPGGTADSPKITMDSAQDVVDNYCMLLPRDGISSMQTLAWWTESGYGCYIQYQASLKFPLNSSIKGVVTSQLMRSKELAKKAAYMVAAQRLLDAGCFNEQLLPFHPTLPLKVEKFFTGLVPFGEVGGAEADTTDGDEANEPEEGELDKEVTTGEAGAADGTVERPIYRRGWYEKKIPKVLTETQLHPQFVYKINFELVKERPTSPWKNLYNFDKASDGFAIVTTNKLPNIGTFPLFGVFGTIHCSLTPIRLCGRGRTSISFQDIGLLYKLERLQDRLFSEVLGIKHPILGKSRQQGYLIVPIMFHKEHWYLNHTPMEEHLNGLVALQRTGRPRRPRDSSVSRVPIKVSKQKYENKVVVAWYKDKSNRKPAYLIDRIAEDRTPSSQLENYGGTYKNFIETQYKGVKIQDPHQSLLRCKLAGIAIGRLEKDPVQMNYLLEKYNKEDELIQDLVPELVFVAEMPASSVVQLKLLPSVLHRIYRLLLAHEVLTDISSTVGWPQSPVSPDGEVVLNDVEMEILSDVHELKKQEETERRKRKLEMRNARIRLKKLKPAESNKQILHIEHRELHYEFIHPNQITFKDIKLFHEAVSTHHAARSLTLKSSEVELLDVELTVPSEFELTDLKDIILKPLGTPLTDTDAGPSLLRLMQAMSSKVSNEGLATEQLHSIGFSFVTFAASYFAFENFPSLGEPLLCQLRNKLMSLNAVLAIAKKKAIPELMAGSNFFPGVTFIPPGQQILRDFLGDLAAKNYLHLNIFDEQLGNRQSRDRLLEMTKEELEKFAEEKLAAASSAALVNPSDDVSQKERQSKKPGSMSSVKHTTFTHTEIPDYEVVNSLFSLVGVFFSDCGIYGAYKALQWLDFKAPDMEGVGRDLSEIILPTSSGQEKPRPDLNLLATQLSEIEDVIQYQFQDKALLVQAFTHPTYLGHHLTKCYQRLEFLGDAILDLLLTYYVYSQPTEGCTEEDLRNIKAGLVNNATFASLAVRYGFQKHLLYMSKPLADMIDNFVVYQESVEHHVTGHFTLITDEECRGPKHIEVPKVLSDVFESLAAAIYLDSGKSIDTVWRIYFRLMEHEIIYFSDKKPQSPVYELQALMKKENIDVQFKRCTSKKTAARGRENFMVEVGHYGKYYGVGTTRFRAREAAAKIALKLIKEETRFIKNRDATRILLLNM